MHSKIVLKLVKVSLLTKKLLEVQITDQKNYLSKSKKVVILKLLN